MATMNSPSPEVKCRKALVCGIGGQDGAYLAEILLARGYEVIGTSRDAASVNLRGLRMLGSRAGEGGVDGAIEDCSWLTLMGVLVVRLRFGVGSIVLPPTMAGDAHRLDWCPS